MARTVSNKTLQARGKSFAKKLKTERLRKAFTQSDLSKKSNVPLDTVRSLENGRIVSPGLFLAVDLVYALDGKLDDWIKTTRVKGD